MVQFDSMRVEGSTRKDSVYHHLNLAMLFTKVSLSTALCLHATRRTKIHDAGKDVRIALSFKGRTFRQGLVLSLSSLELINFIMAAYFMPT